MENSLLSEQSFSCRMEMGISHFTHGSEMCSKDNFFNMGIFPVSFYDTGTGSWLNTAVSFDEDLI